MTNIHPLATVHPGAKLGKSLWEVVPGIERGDREEVIVGTPEEVIKPGSADVVVVCTNSFTRDVFDKLVFVTIFIRFKSQFTLEYRHLSIFHFLTSAIKVVSLISYKTNFICFDSLLEIGLVRDIRFYGIKLRAPSLERVGVLGGGGFGGFPGRPLVMVAFDTTPLKPPKTALNGVRY